ncbi:Stress response protein SCP2 [Tessaracoccus bendigoensis DSM 12906]|uniref:Stress response protein SCP2 n=1 Tax=Tessaracoccus bendigoensis DSM 12906 TaxID=1123357 RepID=A0A1M6EPY5_9ACTN|nr:TerD family protein [Tessaracoccus bendigoensis]SHI87370.1 Stress response protein SCP2 [Tessaracoccus bendigoensis DSM 12906]
MAKRLLAGATVPLVTDRNVPVQRLLIGSTWTNISVDIDMCALLLVRRSGVGYKVATEQDFIYRQRRTNPDRSAFLTYLSPGQSVGPDRAQIMVDFGALNPEVSRIMIAMSAQTPGTSLRNIGTLRTRVMDLATGETLYVYEHTQQAQLDASCVTLWTLDHAGIQWHSRVSVSPYRGGPPALVRDFGARPG